MKTYQKNNNLYQYLHYTSYHQKAISKGIIIGECIRYICTNTNEKNYKNQLHLLSTRLSRRGYPKKFICKCLKKTTYNNRTRYISMSYKPPPVNKKPIFKCIPLPKFTLLKYIILKDFHTIQKYISSQLFITYKHPNLRQTLVNSQCKPTDEQFIDIHLSLPEINTSYTLPAKLNSRPIQSEPCNHLRCVTCQHEYVLYQYLHSHYLLHQTTFLL